ncbi:hypothetical protein L665_04083 [Ralstonia solanacearum SD54]|nr:hypothetical protein L665_04083 [Ralstonia solanacearum SD54]
MTIVRCFRPTMTTNGRTTTSRLTHSPEINRMILSRLAIGLIRAN